jgi:hypothetical protein
MYIWSYELVNIPIENYIYIICIYIYIYITRLTVIVNYGAGPTGSVPMDTCFFWCTKEYNQSL